jgi:cell division protein FtsW
MRQLTSVDSPELSHSFLARSHVKWTIGVHRLMLIISIALIFAMGLIMVFNTTSADILDRSLDINVHQALVKQIIYAMLGCVVAAGAWFLGYKTLLKLSFPLLCFFIFLLVLVFVPGIGIMRNGSHRWIGAVGLTLQPSEFVKLLIPLYFIQYYVSRKEASTLSFRDFLKVVGFLSVPMLLILVEPNNGTAGVIGFTLLTLFILTKVRTRYWLIPMSVLLVVGVIAASQLSYVSNRLEIYLHPESDLQGKGHQPYQAKIAAGSGGVFGRGVGQSVQKLNYLPEAQNDYIAAIFAEEFGFVGMLVLISLYMIIASLGFYIAHRAKDREGFYLAIIITFLIGLQACLNLGVVSGLLPSTGLNLPFFSQGGSSLMANIIGVALLLNIDHASDRQHQEVLS